MLDSEGLWAVARNDSEDARAVLAMSNQAGVPVLVPAAVLAETLFGDGRDARANQVLKRLQVISVTDPIARSAAGLKRDARMTGVAPTIDAIVVATAEHTHAFATLGALQRGKHVYCEKPLTHTVSEARALMEEDRRRNAQAQPENARIAACDVTCGVLDFFHVGQDASGQFSHNFSARRQSDTRMITLKQRNAELIFKHADSPADCRNVYI